MENFCRRDALHTAERFRNSNEERMRRYEQQCQGESQFTNGFPIRLQLRIRRRCLVFGVDFN